MISEAVNVMLTLLILFDLQMGSDICTCPHIFSSKIQVPDLKIRSSYGEHNDLPDQKIVQAIFAQSYHENRKSMVAKKIEENQQKLFEDDKFNVDSKENSRLSVLFNFNAMKTRIYSRNVEPDISIFVQLNIEYCYLTCVCYFLCRRQPRQTLMKQIIETKETNQFGAYSMNFFSNGEKHNVLIDDRMPTHNDSFIYLRIVKGIELWPLIIEKGWCKQIGSYEKAKGLSPEDAFEEITGIPAYSYEFKANNRTQIKKLLTEDPENYWITFVARNGLQDLKNRQVFYLQNIDAQDNYTIISPYSNFTFDNYHQQHRGEVKVKEEDIFTHFEYAVIGYYKPTYVNTTLPIECRSHEEVIIELNIKHREDISIRFNQLYEGYLKEQQRQLYEYSPVLFELYKIDENVGMKGQYYLIQNCQGCSRSTFGARTAHISNKIFESLQGKYLIRLEVNWKHEVLLHKGNLNVYSSQGNVELIQRKNNGQILNEIYKDFFKKKIPKQNINHLNEHNLQVKSFNKLHSTIFSFKNVNTSYQTFEIDFKGSQNIFIRGGEVDNEKTIITLEEEQPIIIEVLPKDIRQGIILESFNIEKKEKVISK